MMTCIGADDGRTGVPEDKSRWLLSEMTGSIPQRRSRMRMLIYFHNIFISYSARDEVIANIVH